MDVLDEATKLVDSFNIDQATASVSLSNLLSYKDMLKYLKESLSSANLRRYTTSEYPNNVIEAKRNTPSLGYSFGWGDGYRETLKLFTKARKHSWDPAFTISNLTKLFKDNEMNYKDALDKNNSEEKISGYQNYYYRSFLCALIDTWEKYTGYKTEQFLS